MLNQLPDDIRAEVLLDFLKEKEVRLRLSGEHKRNVRHDIKQAEELSRGQIQLLLARKSLYDQLPEYCFHTFDRFTLLFKDAFNEELERQQKEIDNARSFFEPVDLMLMALWCEVYRKKTEYVSTNKVLIGMLADSLTEEQQQNRFIRATMPFLRHIRYIRGNRTFITWMIRKVFGDEGLVLRLTRETIIQSSPEPRYNDRMDAPLGETYLGNAFYDTTATYELVCWPFECDKDFLLLAAEVEQYSVFLKDYFLSLEEELSIRLIHREDAVLLSDEKVYNYLNYNTNL